MGVAGVASSQPHRSVTSCAQLAEDAAGFLLRFLSPDLQTDLSL